MTDARQLHDQGTSGAPTSGAPPPPQEAAAGSRRLFLLPADTPLPGAPEWVTRTSDGDHPAIPEVVIDGHVMRDVAYNNAPLAVARKVHAVGPGAMQIVGKYSTALHCLAYPSSPLERKEGGSFEILQNHQDFAWTAQEGCHAVPQLAVQVAMLKQQVGRRTEQQPLYAAVADLGQGRGLVPGSVTQRGFCQISWGNKAHTAKRFWVMCWPAVLPIIEDGLILKKILCVAAAHQTARLQLQPGAETRDQQVEQSTSHLQPSISSLDENVLHVIMGHLVGEKWAGIIQKLWDGRPTSREEAEEICVGAGIPAELCKAW